MEEKKNKKKSLTNSSEVLQGLFENGKSALSEQFLRWKLWKMWAEYVGPSIAAVSEPVGYRRGTLYIWVKNSTWMQQMIFMVEPIKEKINEKLGFKFVRMIHLTLDRKSVPQDPDQKLELKTSIEKLMKEDSDTE